MTMPHEKQGKLSQLPPSPAYKEALTRKALRSAPGSAITPEPTQQMMNTEHQASGVPLMTYSTRYRPSYVRTMAIREESHPRYPPGLAIFPQRHTGPPRISPPPSYDDQYVPQLPQAPVLQPHTVLQTTAISSTVGSSDSNQTSTWSMSMPPSIPTQRTVSAAGRRCIKRSFFDDVMEDHVKAHERYVSKGGRIDPRSLYATLPTNVVDLAAHLGLATSHSRGQQERRGLRANEDSMVRVNSTTPLAKSEVMDRFANHGHNRMYSHTMDCHRRERTGAKVAPFRESVRSNEYSTVAIAAARDVPVSEGGATTCGSCVGPAGSRLCGRRSPSRILSSPSTPRRTRPRKAQAHHFLQAPAPPSSTLDDSMSAGEGPCADTWADRPIPRGSPSPRSHSSKNRKGVKSSDQRRPLPTPPPFIETRHHSEMEASSYIPRPQVSPLDERGAEMLKQIEEFLEGEMRKSRVMNNRSDAAPITRTHGRHRFA